MYWKPKFIVVQYSRDCTKSIPLYFCVILLISFVVLGLILFPPPLSLLFVKWPSCYHIAGFILSLPLKHNKHQKRSLRHKQNPRGEHPRILGDGEEGSPQQFRLTEL